MSNKERTYIMVKPDGVQRGLVGEIIQRFEKRGFKLIALKLVHATKEHLEKHYADLSGKSFFPGLIKYMASGPVVAMVWEGLDAVKTGRAMLGTTNPLQSPIETSAMDPIPSIVLRRRLLCGSLTGLSSILPLRSAGSSSKAILFKTAIRLIREIPIIVTDYGPGTKLGCSPALDHVSQLESTFHQSPPSCKMHFLLLCLSWLSIPLTVFGLKGDWACKSALCIAAVVENNVVHYELSTSLETLGWVGIGFGEIMVHTHSVVLWKNPADGSTILSQRYADAYAEPQVVKSPPRVARVVQPKGLLTQPRPSVIFAFQIPVDTTQPARPDSLQPHIFAYSASPLQSNLNGNLDDPTSHIPFHSHAGVIMLNLSKDFVTSSTRHPPPTESMGEAKAKRHRLEYLIRLHAFLVSFGFLVLLPLGALVARYSRVYKVEWFPYHWKINFYIAGPIITIGALLGPIIIFSKDTHRIHFANGHEITGILLLLLYYIQAFLGQYIHDRRSKLARLGPVTHPHPPLNILHIVLGVSVISIAFCQVYTGMQWWEIITQRGPIANWALPMWKAWIPVLFLAYFGGYALLPRQLRQEREAAAGSHRPVASDDHGQLTPLLAEDREAAPS